LSHLRRVLTVLDYYLPGFKGGGPIRTLANTIEWLGGEFEFSVVTRDRDLGDLYPYEGIPRNVWLKTGSADAPSRVQYLSPEELGWHGLERVLNNAEYDLLYLNSFFSTISVRIMWLLYFRRIAQKPVIVAPRGEFYPGAMAVRQHKKRLYLSSAKALNVYQHVSLWQASTPDEAAAISRIFPAFAEKVHTALDFMAKHIPDDCGRRPPKDGCLRMVSLSRICLNKNLQFVLNLLQDLSVETEYDIYGPIEDEAYWHRCELLLSRLPSCVRVNYRGVLAPDQVVPSLARYHLFVLPTTGESFGHAIWEALCAGCLVLTSDRTPWRNLEALEVGWDISLNHAPMYKTRMEEVASMKPDEFGRRSRLAQAYARSVAQSKTTLEENRLMFLKALRN
jgi:glycosyltransferase involved in cell wall biosynthesis